MLESTEGRQQRVNADTYPDGPFRLLNPQQCSAKQAVRLIVPMLLGQLAVAVHICSRVPLVL